MSRSRSARDDILREQVLEQLTDVIQALLRPAGDTSRLYVRPQAQHIPAADRSRNAVKTFGTSDLTNNLCSALEAVLIHGIKDSYSSRVSSFFTSDPDRMPVPNFWPVIMSVCHKDDIKEVCSLAFITSDVGRGRAWLRHVINGDQVSSYIDAVTRETGVLKDYYRTTSLLRCPESCYQLQGVLQPLATLRFQLATNAAILNTWTQTPLVLAGLWFPPDGHTVQGWSQPLRQGVDAASAVYDDADDIPKRPSVFMEETNLNDHLFNAILAATPSTNFIAVDQDAASENDIDRVPKARPLIVRTLHPTTDEFGNPLPPGMFETEYDSPSNEKESGIGTCEDNNGKPTEGNLLTVNNVANIDDENDSLLGSHVLERTTSDDGSIVTSSSSLDYCTLISKRLDSVDYRYITNDGPFGATLTEDQEESSSDNNENSDDSQEFDVVQEPEHSASFRVVRLSSLVSKLCPQTGLDEQKYQCYNCRAFIGLFYGEFRVCAMDGKSYCSSCHSNDTAVVPARVLYNWDLRQHMVCDSSKTWLHDNIDTPMLDIRATNPKLYSHIEELSLLKTLRTQLLYLRAYLFTCPTEGVADKLKKLIWPREHLHEHVHLYSVSDLLLISSGGLVAEVQDAVCYARLHIRDCRHCQARGFMCEICSKDDVIYPFQLDVAQTCPDCCAVYHRTCTRNVAECPRCVRRKIRRQQLQEQDADSATAQSS